MAKSLSTGTGTVTVTITVTVTLPPHEWIRESPPAAPSRATAGAGAGAARRGMGKLSAGCGGEAGGGESSAAPLGSESMALRCHV